MSTTKIEWATKVWNPVTGCTKVSEACQNCYAERFANRLQKNPKVKGKYENGFKVTWHEEQLLVPAQWKKPQRIFVCSMGDLFHEDVPFGFIDCVFTVMANLDHHTYIILTKRPERMLEFYKWKSKQLGIPWQAKDNVWVGCTTENQQRADERIPFLIQIPASVRLISCEPLLGPIDLAPIFGLHVLKMFAGQNEGSYGLNWIIAGGETGPGARPSHPEWFRSLQNQCEKAIIPFFFKGWGDYYTKSILSTSKEPLFRIFSSFQDWVNTARTWVHGGKCVSIDGTQCKRGADFRKCAYPVAIMDQVGKKNAGRKLDGKEYNEFPKLS